MKISTNWLSEYADLTSLSDEKIAHTLTMTGTKTENFQNISKQLEKIVIGKILSIKKHENADNLLVCQIDIKTKTLQIITSAKNIKENAIVPVCLDGATTANGIKIKSSKIRGVKSEGMLCSIAEIGLSKHDFPYADENGIFLIKEPDCKIGQSVCEAFDLNDTIFEFEITSNRPDCLSATGLARELCASFHIPFNFKPPKNFCQLKNDESCFNVEIKSKNCLRYMAKVVENVKVEPSPNWIKKRLKACGVQSINNIVDITNYVMLEFGIPMHAFDVTQLDGKKIVVRQAENGETLETLMHTTVKLNESDLLICDATKPLVVAGIIGGKQSSISLNTQTILFEVACFEPTCIRKTAQKISARTESSARFEKGLNPNCCEQSMNRACELIELLNAGTVLNSTTDIKNFTKKTEPVEFNPTEINKLIGFNLSKGEMVKILNLLDFKIENEKIQVPDHRIDIKNSADVAEEVARIYGYDKIEPIAPNAIIEPETNLNWLFENELKQILTSLGCDEIYTYSFSNLNEMKNVGINLNEHQKKLVEIANPFGEETKFLKNSTIPAILTSLANNFKNKEETAWLFEIGRIYELDENDAPNEPKKLTIGLYGNGCDFFTLKGMIEALLKKLKIENCSFNALKQMPFHDYVGCEISKGKIKFGKFGEIHPKVCENFKLNCKTFVAVLNLETLFKLTKNNVIFKPISKFPKSKFDLTLVCDENLTCGEIESEIKNSIGEILSSCNVFAIYRDKSLGENLKSISFKIVMQSQTHTLTKAEIEENINKLINNLKKIGATLRQ